MDLFEFINSRDIRAYSFAHDESGSPWKYAAIDRTVLKINRDEKNEGTESNLAFH